MIVCFILNPLRHKLECLAVNLKIKCQMLLQRKCSESQHMVLDGVMSKSCTELSKSPSGFVGHLQCFQDITWSQSKMISWSPKLHRWKFCEQICCCSANIQHSQGEFMLYCSRNSFVSQSYWFSLFAQTLIRLGWFQKLHGCQLSLQSLVISQCSGPHALFMSNISPLNIPH